MSELEKKTLKGSGGHVIANLTPQEVKKGGVAGVDMFLGAIGRIDEKRILKYFCKNCDKEFDGPPDIKFEKVNEEVAKGYTLSEQGEYKCKQCSSVIAQYKTFSEQGEQNPASSDSRTPVPAQQDKENIDFFPIRKLIGVNVYDNNAALLGTVKDVGLIDNRTKLCMIISTTEQTERKIPWELIMRIGDIVVIKTEDDATGLCSECGYKNKEDSKFCEECGNKLS